MDQILRLISNEERSFQSHRELANSLYDQFQICSRSRLRGSNEGVG